MDARATGETLAFEGWHFDRQARLLYRQGASGAWTPVPIGSRAQDILTLLLEQPGTLVSKDAIMEAAWPNTAVEANNLNVQIAALRRVLDRDRSDGSYIQTVHGRGYRFVAAVTKLDEAEVGSIPRTPPGIGSPALGALVPDLGIATAPRLSLVVLPFDYLGGDPNEDYLAEATTDDLTSDLSLIPDVSVTAHDSANAYRGQPKDAQKIGEELRVRYLLKGNLRRFGSTLRVNVQLISAETGAVLWSDRFDEEIGELAVGQEQVVRRIRDEVGTCLIEIENARSRCERPTNPDAFDVTLRARSIRNRPPSRQRDDEAMALLERALLLNPSSVYAMTYIAYYLSHAAGSRDGWGSFENMQRAERLLAQARAIAPDSPVVLNTYLMWLRTVGRCAEVIDAAQRAIQMHPNRIRGLNGIYHELGRCKTWTGQAEEGIALEEETNRLNPRSPWRYLRYRHIGWYSLLLGRDLDTIKHLEKSFAINPDDDGSVHWQYSRLAAAYARIGDMDEAQKYLARANRLWPYDTVRSRAPEALLSSVYIEQFKQFRDALRLAGLRDHANEDADFGVPADAALHGELAGLTPKDAPGAKTISTAEFARFLAEPQQIVIDTVTYLWGRSIPGAVGLKFAGLGGSFTDTAQDHLRTKMHELTLGDLDKPIVAVGWNSERFDGRNLALRLVALGYTNVYWFRGGREAWEVAGLTETEVDVQDW